MTSQRFFCMVVLATVGCSHSSTSSSFESSIAADRPLSSLDPGETKQLCEEGAAVLMPMMNRAGCFMTAILGSAFSQDLSCNDLLDECMADPSEKSLLGALADQETLCTIEPEALTQCSATVGEWSACISGGAELLESVVDKLACNMDPEDMDKDMGQEIAQECEAIAKACPEFFKGAYPGIQL